MSAQAIDVTVTDNGALSVEVFVARGVKGEDASGGGDMLGSNNLSDVDSASDSRDNLGLGSAATSDTGDFDAAGSAATAQAFAIQRANHTGTQTASTISDFDTEVANNSAVALNTAKVSNVSTNLTVGTTTATTLDVNSSDGTNATIPSAIATTAAGLQSGADKAKLDGIELLADVTDAENVKAAIPAVGGYLDPTALVESGGLWPHDMSSYAKSSLDLDSDGQTLVFINIVVGKPGTVTITQDANNSINLTSELQLQGDMADIAAGSNGDQWLLSFEFTSSTTGVATLLPAQS
jgi:hypothetical protein